MSIVTFTLICCSLHKTVQQSLNIDWGNPVHVLPDQERLQLTSKPSLCLVAILLCQESIQGKSLSSVPRDPGIVHSFMRWSPYRVYRNASQKLFVGPERSDTSHSVLPSTCNRIGLYTSETFNQGIPIPTTRTMFR